MSRWWWCKVAIMERPFDTMVTEVNVDPILISTGSTKHRCTYLVTATKLARVATPASFP